MSLPILVRGQRGVAVPPVAELLNQTAHESVIEKSYSNDKQNEIAQQEPVKLL
jgi:hypothetical protein